MTQTKAEVLLRLSPLLRHSTVPPLYVVTRARWDLERATVLAHVAAAFPTGLIAVRSSCRAEDNDDASSAGVYKSVLGIHGGDSAAFAAAVDDVLASYSAVAAADQVLVQQQIERARLTAVVFSRDSTTGAPYWVVEYHRGERTDVVTAGTAEVETYVRFRGCTRAAPPELRGVIAAATEIAALCGDAVDIELAVDGGGAVQLFQVRPLVGARASPIEVPVLADWIEKAKKKVEKLFLPHPHLKGARSVFGVMPDWNPAEMIGTKPRPLALSLYKELITDRTWAQMRRDYGYRDLAGFPLLVSLLGVPFIDVRASFNSFVPASVSDELAGKLVDHYVERLLENPHLHDKVEFDIVVSCFFPGLDGSARGLTAAGFRDDEVAELLGALRSMTARILRRESGVLATDVRRIEVLQQRQRAVAESEMSTVARIYWLLEDCRAFGTLAFCGLARAAFIATQFLRGLVSTGLLDGEEHEAFNASLRTVAGELADDVAGVAAGVLDRSELLARWGHLRPGTYDILSRRYDEAFEEYFSSVVATPSRRAFVPSERTLRRVDAYLRAEDLPLNTDELFAFMRAAIEGRERAKLHFTRNISDALVLLETLGQRVGIAREELSWLSISTVTALYASLDALDLRDILLRDIEMNRRAYETTARVRLPDLITSADDVEHFHMHQTRPNFVGRARVVGDTAVGDLTRQELRGRIVCVAAADPGYDWVFSRGIAGLVTTYGGANSHMAIRAAELGVPAAIGCGAANCERWFRARRLELDCGNALVRVIA